MKVRGILEFIGMELCTGLHSGEHTMTYIQYMNIGRILRNRLTCGFQIKQNCELETFCRHMWYLMIRRDGKAGRQVAGRQVTIT